MRACRVEAPTKTMRIVFFTSGKADGRSPPTELVGDQSHRRRGVRQVSINRTLLAAGRVVDEQPAGCAGKEILGARLADKGGVPCLEHVPRLEIESV